MTCFIVRHPMRAKPIGRHHDTRAEARKAALRAAKRLGHATVCHWQRGRIETVFADGSIIAALQPNPL